MSSGENFKKNKFLLSTSNFSMKWEAKSSTESEDGGGEVEKV